jgi:transcription initiation factor TFIID subunit 5
MSGSTGPAGAAGGPYAAPAQGTGASGGQPAAQSNPSDLNKIVTDYLLKKGYTKTEATFRKESANLGPDGRPVKKRAEEMGPERFLKAYNLLSHWIENGLDLYKFELRKLLWPFFVYSFLELVSQNCAAEAADLYQRLKPDFEVVHGDDLKTFATITLSQHVNENPVTKLYRSNKYRIPLNQHVAGQLFSFLERESDTGGSVIIDILQNHCRVESIARGPIEPYSFEAIYRRGQNLGLDEVDAQEGIPGVFTGVNTRDGINTHAALRLGPMPMEVELRDDVRAELEELDQRLPPAEGVPTLVDEFDRKIKREESADGPSRTDIPLPPSRARDVIMEMQKVRENRDRFKIEGRTGGVGVPVTICMFTFHNTCGRLVADLL